MLSKLHISWYKSLCSKALCFNNNTHNRFRYHLLFFKSTSTWFSRSAFSYFSWFTSIYLFVIYLYLTVCFSLVISNNFLCLSSSLLSRITFYEVTSTFLFSFFIFIFVLLFLWLSSFNYASNCSFYFTTSLICICNLLLYSIRELIWWLANSDLFINLQFLIDTFAFKFFSSTISFFKYPAFLVRLSFYSIPY